MQIRCGHCQKRHRCVALVKACAAGELFACNWLVFDQGEDGPFTRDCGADAWYTHDGRGWECDRGHSHVDAETRAAQGWDYADGPVEARRLAEAGVFPMLMDGTGPAHL